MRHSRLGQNGPKVSKICLGTMTFGEQNTEAEAHAQLDFAFERGVNFIDTAEMYPVPANAKTSGDTERFIGNWLKKSGLRDRVVVATKIVGPAPWMAHIRGGSIYNRKQISEAVDASLKRLRTDYIDLYQLHWPERSTNFFGELGYRHVDGESFTPFEEVLEGLKTAIDAGKLGHVGVSNESAWGLMSYLNVAQRTGLPRMVTIQNPYSLLSRAFEVGLAEVAIREDCGLLAYSPLSFGVLTGKYLDGAMPPGSRLQLYRKFDRYLNPVAQEATRAYVNIAREHGLDPAQMALSYVTSRSFTTATIIGATSLDQLEINLDSLDIELDDEILRKIEDVHSRYSNPAP